VKIAVAAELPASGKCSLPAIWCVAVVSLTCRGQTDAGQLVAPEPAAVIVG